MAGQLGVSRPTVIKWRDRFAESGIAGLDDEPRSGRPKTVDDAAILAATLELFNRFGEPNVSTLEIANELGISPLTIPPAGKWRLP